MKKNLSIFIILLAVITIASFIYHELRLEFAEKALQEKIEAKTFKASVPDNYCLVTYKVSTDNEKTWHQVVINSGQKPIYKAQCWKKYIHILDGFDASTTPDGRWYSKKQKGKTIDHPSMHFSNIPFESLPKNPKLDLPSDNAQSKTAA
jgi:uncharacterized protein YxeA